MSTPIISGQSLWGLVTSGGFTMYPLVACSLVVWGVIFERLWNYRRLDQSLNSFHLEAMNSLLRNDLDALRSHCQRNERLPTARLVVVALDRLASKDQRLKDKWKDA